MSKLSLGRGLVLGLDMENTYQINLLKKVGYDTDIQIEYVVFFICAFVPFFRSGHVNLQVFCSLLIFVVFTT